MHKVRKVRDCNKSFKNIFHFFDVTTATFFQFKSKTAFRLKINLSRKSNIAKLAPVEHGPYVTNYCLPGPRSGTNQADKAS